MQSRLLISHKKGSYRQYHSHDWIKWRHQCSGYSRYITPDSHKKEWCVMDTYMEISDGTQNDQLFSTKYPYGYYLLRSSMCMVCVGSQWYSLSSHFTDYLLPKRNTEYGIDHTYYHRHDDWLLHWCIFCRILQRWISIRLTLGVIKKRIFFSCLWEWWFTGYHRFIQKYHVLRQRLNTWMFHKPRKK